MPHDPVVTVTPGRVIIDGRFGVISADELRPIHVEIGVESLREVAATGALHSDGPVPAGVTAWGNLFTYIQESLAFAVGDSEPGSLVTVVLP